MAKFATIVLAYNRRVDADVTPAGQESAVQYPIKSEDFARLIDRNGPEKEGSVVNAAEKENVKK